MRNVVSSRFAIYFLDYFGYKSIWRERILTLIMTTVLSSLEIPRHSEEKRESLSSSSSVNEEKLPLGVPIENVGGGLWAKWTRKSDFDLDSIATQPSVFDSPLTCEVYRPPSQYENAHRFDPNARWSWREEKVPCLCMQWFDLMNTFRRMQALVRKVDWRVMVRCRFPAKDSCTDSETLALGWNHVLRVRFGPEQHISSKF